MTNHYTHILYNNRHSFRTPLCPCLSLFYIQILYNYRYSSKTPLYVSSSIFCIKCYIITNMCLESPFCASLPLFTIQILYNYWYSSRTTPSPTDIHLEPPPPLFPLYPSSSLFYTQILYNNRYAIRNPLLCPSLSLRDIYITFIIRYWQMSLS